VQGEDRTAAGGRPPACCPCQVRRGKGGLYAQGEARTVGDGGLSALADAVAELAAAEARRLVHAAAELLGHEGNAATGVLEAIERAAQASAATIGLAAVSGVVDWAGAHAPARAQCPREEAHTARLVARRAKTVRTLLGPLVVARGYYHCKVCKQGFTPLDARLGVQRTSLSPGLARAAALAGSEMPYAKSFDLIGAVTGLDLASTSTLARTTRREGGRARTLINAEHAATKATPRPVPAADHTAGAGLCYVVMDGTGAPMLPRETTGRTGKDGTRAGTREVKIACLFTQCGFDPVSAEPVQDPGSATYISTFAPAADFATQVKAEYLRRDFDAVRQPVVLGDGARWIWNIADRHFTTATQIVDYFHAREHLADLTKLLAPVLEDPDAWQQHLADRLDLGDTTAIADAVTTLDLDERAPDLVRPAATQIGYFTTNHHRMQYADFKANGYYIGSGPVESACNTIVKQRAKRAGMHWTITGLDPVLALRTLHQSRRDHILWPTTTSPTPQT
jgi:hypothetical protein